MKRLAFLIPLLLMGCGTDEVPVAPDVNVASMEQHGPCLGPGVDLSPMGLEWTNDHPGRVGVDWRLRNLGCDEEPGWVGVIYKVDGPGGDWYYSYYQIPQGGNYSNISWDCYVELPGTYEIKVFVDYWYDVDETNENNNEASTGKFEAVPADMSFIDWIEAAMWAWRHAYGDNDEIGGGGAGGGGGDCG